MRSLSIGTFTTLSCFKPLATKLWAPPRPPWEDSGFGFVGTVRERVQLTVEAPAGPVVSFYLDFRDRRLNLPAQQTDLG